MYVESREGGLYQYTARQKRVESNTEDSEDEQSEDFYLKEGEELDFS